METIKIEERINRDVDAIACPKCNGYADRVEATKEEIEKQSCRLPWECCIGVFVCRLCKSRLISEAEAPEME